MLHVGAWEGYGTLISIVRREARNETLLADDEKGKDCGTVRGQTVGSGAVGAGEVGGYMTGA
jgi:hypothetical protein